MSRRCSVLWKVFNIEDQAKHMARCDICLQLFSYKTSTSNLKKHLLKKHPTVKISDNVIQYVPEQIQEPQNDPSSFIIMEDIQYLDDKCEMVAEYDLKNVDRRSSVLWKVFTIEDKAKKMAKCDICKQQFSYKTTTTNLKTHLLKKHPTVQISDNVIQYVPQQIKELQDDPSLVIITKGIQNINDEKCEMVEKFDLKNEDRRSSVLWKVFTIEDKAKQMAKCDICKQLFSYKTSITNLKTHLLKKHPTVQISDNVIQYVPEQIQEQQNDPSSVIVTQDFQKIKSSYRKKRSSIWNVFTRTSSTGKALCNICKKVLSWKSTATNLHKHLQRKHPKFKLQGKEEVDSEENRSRSPLHSSTFEVYIETADNKYVTIDLPDSSFASPIDPIEVQSLVPIPIVDDNIQLKEENYKEKQLSHIDDIINKLNTEDQQQIKQLLYGNNYEALKLPDGIVQTARNLRFELASYKFPSAPEQVRKSRLVRLAALQTTLPLPTSTPIVEMRKAIHNRAAEAIEIAAQANVNIFGLQDLWTAPFFLCTGEKYPWCEYAEPAESGPTTEFLQKLAKKHNMVIVSPILERDELHNDTVWNSAVVIDNHGDVLGKHRKNHISRVTGFNESTYYNEGNTGHPVFQTEFGRIAINISHGRHHPLNWMMFGINGAEIVFNPSVEAGTESELLWNIESRCAAMNNSFFTCAINRVGTENFPKEKFGHLYGSSYVTAPDGTRTPGLSRTGDGILITEFDLNMCRRARDFWGFQPSRRLDLYAESFNKVTKLDYQPQIIKK